jgi:hypothetical protein
MVMILVEIVMSIPHIGPEGYENIMQLSFQSSASSYDSRVAGIIKDSGGTGQKVIG